MNRHDLLFATIAAVLIAGCASVTTPTAEPQDKTVITGSRLPARDGAASADVKSIRTQEGIDDMMKRGSIIIPPRGGGM